MDPNARLQGSNPVGMVIRFSTSDRSWGSSPTTDMLVTEVKDGWVRGLTMDRTPTAIAESSIVDASVVDAGPHGPPDPLIRTYLGKPNERNANFAREAPMFRDLGYDVGQQTVNEGHWRGVDILAGVLLFFLLIGFLIIILMLLTKPSGSLTVTYRLRVQVPVVPFEATKACPRCAETIKAAAIVCRFCGHNQLAA